MPLSTVKPMMAEAEALLVSSGLADSDELIAICTQALGLLAGEADAYCKTMSYGRRFVPHFIEQLSALVRLLEPAASSETKGFTLFGEVQARSFALVEDMALFIREKMLRNGAVAEFPLEEKILSYFESCGNWSLANGEKVTDAYYCLLPISVMNDMAKSAYSMSR